MTKRLDPAEKERRRQERSRLDNKARSKKKIAWAKARRQAARLALFERYGGKCACCGLADYRWLSIHHKNRDGAAERRREPVSSASRMLHYARQPVRDDLELLCFNCHLARDLYGQCPHCDPASPYYLHRDASSASMTFINSSLASLQS